jgi:hypothetical protein
MASLASLPRYSTEGDYGWVASIIELEIMYSYRLISIPEIAYLSMKTAASDAPIPPWLGAQKL